MVISGAVVLLFLALTLGAVGSLGATVPGPPTNVELSIVSGKSLKVSF